MFLMMAFQSGLGFQEVALEIISSNKAVIITSDKNACKNWHV